MAIDKVIIKNKPNADSYGQYNYYEGLLTGANFTDTELDLYTESKNSVLNSQIISNVPFLRSRGIKVGYKMQYFNGINDVTGIDLHYQDLDVHFYMIDDAVTPSIKACMRSGYGNSILQNPYVGGGTGLQADTYNCIYNVITNNGTFDWNNSPYKIFYHRPDDGNLNEHNAFQKTIWTYEHGYPDIENNFLEDIVANPKENIDGPHTNYHGAGHGLFDNLNKLDTDVNKWYKSFYDDGYENNYYFISRQDGNSSTLGGSLGFSNRVASLTVFKVPKRFLYALLNSGNANYNDIENFYETLDVNVDNEASLEENINSNTKYIKDIYMSWTHSSLSYDNSDDVDFNGNWSIFGGANDYHLIKANSMPGFVSVNNPQAGSVYPVMLPGRFYLHFQREISNSDSGWNFSDISEDEQDFYNYSDSYNFTQNNNYFTVGELYLAKPNNVIDIFGTPTTIDDEPITSNLLNNELNFRPISLVTTEVDFVSNVYDSLQTDLQTYYEDVGLSIEEQSFVSAPNVVKLSIKLAKDNSFNVQYLTEDDVYDEIGYVAFVTNWNNTDTSIDLDTLSNQFPTSLNQVNSLQQSTNTYHYISESVEVETGDLIFESENLTKTYQSSGIKNIQVVVFSHIQNPNDENLYQPLQWKLLNIRFYLDVDLGIIEDFSELGGFDFTTIPWPKTVPIIGGISTKSKYYKSLRQLYSFDVFNDAELIDRKKVRQSFKNDELGKYYGNNDLAQLRYFNNGTYDLNYLLNIQDTAFSADGLTYNKPDNSDYWDGIINKFPDESCVGKIFINDEMDIEFKNSCKLEFNFSDVDNDNVRDSTGNNNTGVLLGDYEIKKDSKQSPLSRDESLDVPVISSNDLAF